MSSLYKLLGIVKTASDQEVTSAYRKMALQFHPDRNPDGSEQFKKINEAYSVLSDKAKRASYDKTGVIPGSGDASTDKEDEAHRSSEISREIAEFYKIYRNSPEERSDIFKAFEATGGGDLEEMVHAHLLFDNGIDGEVVRIAGVVTAAIGAGELKPGKKWKKSSAPSRVQKLVDALIEERKEAERSLEKIHGDANYSAASAVGGGSLQALILSRQKEQAASWNSFLDDVMARCEAKKTKKGAVEPAKKKSRKE
jgi:DnaJ family protein C protein 9